MSITFRYSDVLTCVKKDNMVSCRSLGCTNRANKNSNIITLAILIMLLELYPSIFRTLVYLMSEAIFSQSFSGIFKDIQHNESI